RIDRRRKLPVSILLRALGYSTQEILDEFFESNTFYLKENSIELELIPERLKGEIASFEIRESGANGKVIVEEGRRITAKHVKHMSKAGIERLSVPDMYLNDKRLAKTVVDLDTGEVIAEANTEITSELLKLLREKNIPKIQLLYTNEL